MSKVKSKDSKAELLLRRSLYSKGYRYRLHVKNIFGKPDILFKSKRVAVFVDGDFWHGRNYEKERHKYQENWAKKIAGNMKRDKEVNRELKKTGWKVIRVWEKDILKDPKKSTDKVTGVLQRI